MIRLSETRTLDNYFIDENGVITDLNGNVQEIKICGDRPTFKSQFIHKIMMFTFYGYRNGKVWDIHHLDENKLNNSLNNLVYLTHSEHAKLHSLNQSEETKQKNRIAHIGNKAFFGHKHSEETKKRISDSNKGKHNGGYKLSLNTKQKIGESMKGMKWFNDGIKNYRCKECPVGCIEGRIFTKKI